jgi:hypothetical protein
VGGGDESCAHHDLALVEDRRLSRGNAVGRLVERDAEPASLVLHGRRHGGRAIAQLGLDAADRKEEAPVADADLTARERFSWADDHCVRAGVGAKCIQRLPGRDTEAATLSRREAPEASVTAELAPFLVEDRAVPFVQSLASGKIPVVGAREEARL